ncbi:Protein CBG06814 [Caenorhabditis briggsae]|uniref:Uncharacterized protein n=2 Tax=Caenorhabditis briggsae TaxID=6238 RepID=A0AAE9EJ35_CAEBR|nr:Protein CBG06814 [Caenorhabditis briggsae]ULU02362.1 hypothetical protein L3Y34_002141 [Caenorhabditis briggsae]UMM24983.1 hypothetical protein L5515_004969 [Caenorhabditis briggsae]CAP27060.2 Protein CBG06814 [Caenorhabditis briggsae]
MSRLLYIIPILLLFCTLPVASLNSKRSDPMFLALACPNQCEVRVRFLESMSGLSVYNNTTPIFQMILSSTNGTLDEHRLHVPEDVSVLEFVFEPREDFNGTINQETSVWDLTYSETYFHSSGGGSLYMFGNLPCGKYGCPQNPLCDAGCRFTVIASIGAFCLSILAGLILQTVYVSFLGFRKTRKELEIRDTLRLTESAEPSH